MLRGTIEVAVEASDDDSPPPPDAHPAVWGDEHLALEGLLTESQQHRARIDGRLQKQGTRASP